MTRARDVADTQDNLGGAVAPFVAGKNGVINGAFDIWQRGTSITLGATQAYTADRWYSYRGGLVTGYIVSRQASSLTGIQYAARVQRNTGDTSTQVLTFQYNAESADSYRFAGQTVTMSFYVRAGANYSAASSALNFTLQYGTGTDQTLANGLTGQTAVVSTAATLTTSWQRVTATASIPSTATQVVMSFTYTPVGTAGAADYFEVTGVQVEIGAVATPFARAGGSIGGELALCQRYYYRIAPGLANAIIGLGFASSTTSARMQFASKVTMRVSPTSIEYAGGYLSDGVNAFTTLSSITNNAVGPNNLSASINVASGLTQFRPYDFDTLNTTDYIAWSAEL